MNPNNHSFSNSQNSNAQLSYPYPNFCFLNHKILILIHKLRILNNNFYILKIIFQKCNSQKYNFEFSNIKMIVEYKRDTYIT